VTPEDIKFEYSGQLQIGGLNFKSDKKYNNNPSKLFVTLQSFAASQCAFPVGMPPLG
jgi:hypothetical protein